MQRLILSRDAFLSHDMCRALVVGVGFKPGQSVLSHSLGVAMIESLQKNWGADVTFADPFVQKVPLEGVSRIGLDDWRGERLESYDLIVVIVRQPGLDLSLLDGLHKPLIHYCCEK